MSAGSQIQMAPQTTVNTGQPLHNQDSNMSTGSSHSDKEVDALTPEKSAAMRGSNVGPGSALVPPIGATPTIAMPERKRKRKGDEGVGGGGGGGGKQRHNQSDKNIREYFSKQPPSSSPVRHTGAKSPSPQGANYPMYPPSPSASLPLGADFLRSTSQQRPHTSEKKISTELTCQRIQELETQASSDLEVRNNRIDELTRNNEDLKHQVQAQSKVIDEQKSHINKCIEVVKKLLNEKSTIEKKEARQRCMQNRLRLGQFVTQRVGATFQENWTDGYAFQELTRRQEEITAEKEEIDRQKKLLSKKRPSNEGGGGRGKRTSSVSAPATPQPHPHTHHNKQQFHFPEIKTPVSSPNHTSTVQSPARSHVEIKEELTSSIKSEGSGRVSLSGSGSTDSGRHDPTLDNRWPRQNSLSMKEWDIPYDELKLFEMIGTGRFGTVYRGSWHGAVAVKLLHVNALSDHSVPLDTFKHEVATFRKTRHENLVLFMGACMKPPRLAIVTSLCKGMTLYTHIHLRKDKFTANKSVIVAQQISQGMGYLHARGIIHKDLKTKNIFLENGKVVITDFGLFSVTKLCFGNNARGDSLGIPPGWLCYLAPELVRALRPHASLHLPFSKATDVYAFGTVWYELLCGEYPFKGQPPEAIIWQVGKGMKQSLANMQASRDIKDILMLCWSYHSPERPDFSRLLPRLEKLPRKRLARSPSHPVHLSRSADSVF